MLQKMLVLASRHVGETAMRCTQHSCSFPKEIKNNALNFAKLHWSWQLLSLSLPLSLTVTQIKESHWTFRVRRRGTVKFSKRHLHTHLSSWRNIRSGMNLFIFSTRVDSKSVTWQNAHCTCTSLKQVADRVHGKQTKSNIVHMPADLFILIWSEIIEFWFQTSDSPWFVQRSELYSNFAQRSCLSFQFDLWLFEWWKVIWNLSWKMKTALQKQCAYKNSSQVIPSLRQQFELLPLILTIFLPLPFHIPPYSSYPSYP